MTSLSYAQKRQSFAVNGPTAQSLPPFQWTPAFNGTAHEGQAEVFDFKFQLMQPEDPADA